MNIDKLLEKKLEAKTSANVKSIFTEKEINFIIKFLYNLYDSGISLKKISKSYPFFNSDNLSKRFKNKNLKVTNKQNRLRVREDLFETISTEEDAYWLGFLYADGYISDNGTVEITLAHKDLNHLYKWASFIDFNGKLYLNKEVTLNDKKFICNRLSFASQKLKNRFFNRGIVPRKSCILNFPTEEQIPIHLLNHFIRGYLDGDGSIISGKGSERNSNSFRAYRISFVGTKNILRGILNNLPVINKKANKLRKKGNCAYQLEIGGNIQVKRILDHLYKDAAIYLERKNEKYKEFCRYLEQSR